MISRFALFKEIRRHKKLANERRVQNKGTKMAGVFNAFGIITIIISLLFCAIMFAFIANTDHELTALQLFCGLTPMILGFDFMTRYYLEEPPSQFVKPYLLLNVPKRSCIDALIAEPILDATNLVYLALLIPFILMSVVFSYGVLPSCLLLIFFYLLVFSSIQFRQICQTLTKRSQLWWCLPIGLIVLILVPFYFQEGNVIDNFCQFCGSAGTAMQENSIVPILIAIALLCLTVFANRLVQNNEILRETHKTDNAPIAIPVVAALKGSIGSYIGLEIRNIIRNKNPRQAFISAFSFILLLGVMIAFTDVYDRPLFAIFWCFYCYSFIGNVILSRCMCFEGNYIEVLMTRRENILDMLHAKYYIYTALLIVPFLLQLPPVIKGKWSLFMLIAYGIFTAGVIYFTLFQMAVYNNITVPLNQKAIDLGSKDYKRVQVYMQLAVMFAPIIVIGTLQFLFDKNVCYTILTIIGLAFIVTEPIWMRNIYKRMMKRRYENIEGFIASRVK